MQDALRLLDREEGSGGVHELTEEVVATLGELQFDPGPVVKGALLRQGKVPNPPQPVIFEVITAEAIKRAAEKTKGSHGPSGVDAELWKKQLLSFGPSSHALREAIAAATRRLCSTFVDPVCLEALLACRLLPLMKKGGRVQANWHWRSPQADHWQIHCPCIAQGYHGEFGIVEPLWRTASRLRNNRPFDD